MSDARLRALAREVALTGGLAARVRLLVAKIGLAACAGVLTRIQRQDTENTERSRRRG